MVAANPRWEFWKCYHRLRLDGHGWNHKRVYRVYHALGLHLPRRTRRSVRRRSAPGPLPPACAVTIPCSTINTFARFEALNSTGSVTT